jgi:hypothetical protein
MQKRVLQFKLLLRNLQTFLACTESALGGPVGCEVHTSIILWEEAEGPLSCAQAPTNVANVATLVRLTNLILNPNSRKWMT